MKKKLSFYLRYIFITLWLLSLFAAVYDSVNMGKNLRLYGKQSNIDCRGGEGKYPETEIGLRRGQHHVQYKEGENISHTQTVYTR